MPAGRPTRYRKTYPKKAYDFCREHGFIDTELGEMFDVPEKTINAWKQKHPKFRVSIEKGKDDYDSNEVEKSLRRRALGYEYKEITEEPGKAADPETGEAKMMVVKVVTKQVIPDVAAGRLWLINRKPHRWHDRQLHEVTGPGGGPIIYEPTDRFVFPEDKGSPEEKSPEEQDEDY